LRFTENRRWDFVDKRPDWLAEGDLPAAPLGDLRPSVDNKISVWLIEDDGSNLNRVLAGYVANRNIGVDKQDAIVVDLAKVDSLGIRREKAPGQSRDAQAAKLWHWNLVEMSYNKILALTHVMAEEGTSIRRDADQLKQLIVDSIRAGWFNIDALPERVQADIRPLLEP
jgi:hypothetical protein